MLIQCKSCEKKFIVPDSAIGPGGRLVQCSSCGNKWTQLPLKVDQIKKDKITVKNEVPKKVSIKKIPKKNRKNKNQIAKFSKEYLHKKYNLKIENPKVEKVKKKQRNTTVIGFGFYSYLTVMVVFLVAIFGAIHLSKEIIILYLPITSSDISYFNKISERAIFFGDSISDHNAAKEFGMEFVFISGYSEWKHPDPSIKYQFLDFNEILEVLI